MHGEAPIIVPILPLMRTLAVPTVLLALVAVTALDARVKVQIDHDKQFNFKAVKTWDWNPQARGHVKMARTQTDDPDAVQRRAEPIIIDAVVKEMSARGLSQSTGLQPDIVVTYYLLLTTNMSTQEAGQFLPIVANWGLPPFPMSTTSIKVLNRGSLVLDLDAKGAVVWRGVAQAELQPDASEKQRESKIRESVRDLLKRFPPKN
jgi:hypothetical protein